MKHVLVLFFTSILLLFTIASVDAQAAESIWLEAANTAYKKAETVLVTIKAASATPIQGFTFQIRYDPACLQPANASSPISGMNGLFLPQTPGLVDASFASTVPQAANGILAEVQFLALAGCQTNLTLESAGLAIRNASGFAAPLPGVTISTNAVALNIDSAPGDAQEPQLLGTPLALGSEADSGAGRPSFLIIAFSVLLGLIVIGGIVFVVSKMF